MMAASLRIAVVVQRCHASIAGGSERYAAELAALLAERHSVEILTTTALDAATWANVLPAGSGVEDGLHIRRFPVTTGRRADFTRAHTALLDSHHSLTTEPREYAFPRLESATRFAALSLAQQEDWIRSQGPQSPELIEWIRSHRNAYDLFCFITYLYAPSYFGLIAARGRPMLFAPTLHDEAPAYMECYAQAARLASHLIWNAPAEQSLAARLWGPLPGSFIGMHVQDAPGETSALPAEASAPYFLYCGRMDAGKGAQALIEMFRRWRAGRRAAPELLLIGRLAMQFRNEPGVRYLGFVSEAAKFALMARARALLMPSEMESLSLVTLESFAQGAPVIATGRGSVVRDHVVASGGGLLFEDEAGLFAALDALASDDLQRAQLGAAGRNYVQARFSKAAVRARLEAAVAAAVRAAPQ